MTEKEKQNKASSESKTKITEDNLESAKNVDERINEEMKKDLDCLECNHEDKPIDADTCKTQNEQMKKIFIGAGIFLGVFLIVFLFIYSVRNVEYHGVKLEVVKEGNLIFYKNAIHMFSPTGNHIADYNIYLRNDPRKISKIPFNGDMVIMDNIVLGTEKGKDFQCDGDGIISVANFANLFQKATLKNIVRNDSLGCDSQGRWTSIQFYEGNQTRIDQVGLSCYKISMSNCDILNATERFMYEYLVDVNQEKDIKIEA